MMPARRPDVQVWVSAPSESASHPALTRLLSLAVISEAVLVVSDSLQGGLLSGAMYALGAYALALSVLILFKRALDGARRYLARRTELTDRSRLAIWRLFALGTGAIALVIVLVGMVMPLWLSDMVGRSVTAGP